MTPEELQAVEYIISAIFILHGTLVGMFFWWWWK